MWYLSRLCVRPAAKGDDVLSVFAEQPGNGEYRSLCEHLMRVLERADYPPRFLRVVPDQGW